MHIRIEKFNKPERWSVRSEENEILYYGSLQQCEMHILAKEREANINKSDFNKQKSFTTTPIGGHIKN
jgi:hypothetical protein